MCKNEYIFKKLNCEACVNSRKMGSIPAEYPRGYSSTIGVIFGYSKKFVDIQLPLGKKILNHYFGFCYKGFDIKSYISSSVLI